MPPNSNQLILEFPINSSDGNDGNNDDIEGHENESIHDLFLRTQEFTEDRSTGGSGNIEAYKYENFEAHMRKIEENIFIMAKSTSEYCAMLEKKISSLEKIHEEKQLKLAECESPEQVEYQVSPWRRSITPEMRNFNIRQLCDVKYPNQGIDPTALTKQLKIGGNRHNFVSEMTRIEENIYNSAASKSAYYYMLGDRLHLLETETKKLHIEKEKKNPKIIQIENMVQGGLNQYQKTSKITNANPTLMDPMKKKIEVISPVGQFENPQRQFEYKIETVPIQFQQQSFPQFSWTQNIQPTLSGSIPSMMPPHPSGFYWTKPHVIQHIPGTQMTFQQPNGQPIGVPVVPQTFQHQWFPMSS